ncbi:uncharacterized protein LOC108673932 [Hyalella azteca]|uniref:Uncharacterized protein LOC108673932 n=1 Tax=Hyalella azteca TaxID=294128 RepID=A0A8B7NU67_HYAAZ|nr:uncharacterized protein LOC108673932 [Hyalella azteca]
MKKLLALLLAVMAATSAQKLNVTYVTEKPDTEAFLKVLYNDSYPLDPIKMGNFKIPDLEALAYGKFFPCWGRCTDGRRMGYCNFWWNGCGKGRRIKSNCVNCDPYYCICCHFGFFF